MFTFVVLWQLCRYLGKHGIYLYFYIKLNSWNWTAYINYVLNIFSTSKLYICPPSFPDIGPSNTTTPAEATLKIYRNNDSLSEEEINIGECYKPEYVVFTWIICLVALTSILKLYYLIKTLLALINVALYAVLLLIYYNVDYYSSPARDT